MTLEQIGPLTQIVPVYGLNFWYHAIYSYLLVVAGSYFLIKKLFSFERKLRKQAFAIGVGVLFPLIGNIVYSFGYNPLVIRLTPILFIVTGITFTWGIFRYHFLNITQIATRTIFEHIRDAIFVLNIEDQVIDVNPYGLELMDLQIVGSSMKKIFGSKAEEFFRKNIDLIAIINNPDKDNKEIKIEHNGEELYFDTRISPIFNKKQNVIGKVVILRDITNIKNTERRLIKTEKLAALGGLVAGVAHEINTPVGISITASSTLMEETDKMVGLYKEDKINRVNFKEYLSMANQTAKLILSNMERTATMIQSFKLVSVDQSTGQQRIFNLKEYTFDVIRSLYPRLKNRKIKIVLDMDDKIDLDSFPGAFSQIITNLVLNSLTHGFKEKEKGKIEIMAKLDKKELVLEYSDYGRGIHEEHMGTIFEPFFTTDKKMGTGLGLYIIYNIVTQKLNGSIECTSELNKRTTFLIKIPVRD
jgi:PAS domain S-box-containing protein